MEQIQTPPQELVDEFVGVSHGDFERVKTLLEQNPALINARASWNELAIEAAAQTGSVEIAEYLLAAGAGLDIFTAAMLGRRAQVETFLGANPDLVHTAGVHGIPILWFPIIRGHQDIAELLLNQGADINAGEGGNPALHGAVFFGQTSMVAWLLSKGARTDLDNYQGKKPLEIAMEKKNQQIIDLLQTHSEG